MAMIEIGVELQVQDDFAQMIEADNNLPQAIYWLSRWHNLPEWQVREMVIGKPAKPVSAEFELYD